MSNYPIWGNMPKSTLDNQTIDEAQALAISAHNDDPDAHLEAGQSLQSHRAAEVIDHLAESVVNDKIANNARTYVAIVDPNDQYSFATVQSAVTYAISKGGGNIYITRGVHFVSADIYVPPTIGFYGDGMGESIMRSNSSTTYMLRFFNTVQACEGSAYILQAQCGTHIIPYDAGGTGYADPIPNMFYSTGGLVPAYLTVSSYDATAHQITTAEVIPAFVDELDGSFFAGAVFTNGSSQVQLITNTNMSTQLYFPGISVTDMKNTLDYVTIGLDENNILTLAVPYSGADKTVPISMAYKGTATIGFNGIELSGLTNRVAIQQGAPNCSSYIENCRNVIVPTAGAIGSHSTYIGCIFDCTASTQFVIANDVLYLNCSFVASVNASVGIYLSGYGQVIGCHFYANGFTNHLWIAGVAQPASILSNIFESQAGVTVFNNVGNSTAPGMKWAFNSFTFENNASITFQCRNSIFQGNKFTFAGTGALVMNATSTENIFANNIIVGTITDGGTDNTWDCNKTTLSTRYYTLATAGTACDLLNNEVVYHNPTAGKTLTSTVPRAGDTRILILHQSNTTAITITFGTGFKTVGTLALGTVLGRKFQMNFVSDGTNLIEVSRSGAIVA